MLSEKYVCKTFSSYEDLLEKFKINVPDNFNFGFDVVDLIADKDPDKKALVWCNEHGDERIFTFGDIKKYSNKAANFFKSLGIKKGDAVMLILKRRYEFWFAIIALHKIGAVPIPATHLLTEKDIVYRNNAADIKMIVSVATDNVPETINKAEHESPSLKYKVSVHGGVEGWYNFTAEMEKQPDVFKRPEGEDATVNEDKFLLYFTSGTTGMPKMVLHDYAHPLGQTVTAKFWHDLTEHDVHFTSSDTGWAKCGWGKIFGQWICGACIFVYDYRTKFHATELLPLIEKYGIMFVLDVQGALDTFDRLEATEARWFVPSHAPATEDIGPLVETNRRGMLRIGEMILDCCTDPSSREFIVAAVAERLGLSMTPSEYVLNSAAISAHLTRLARNGALTPAVEEGVLLWRRS